MITKQFGRSATSIGANVWEADHSLTDSEFAHKISISCKESAETEYWLTLASRAGLLPVAAAEPLLTEAGELTRILGTIVRRTQQHLDRET